MAADRIYLDRGLTGTNRRRPGLDQALAAVHAWPGCAPTPRTWPRAATRPSATSRTPHRVRPARRDVRPTRDFFLDLDRQLLAQRGPRGELSRTDFQTHDLLLIIDRFATGWDDLPQLIPGPDDYRVLISAGVLVRALAVEAQLASDGVIELVRLSIATTWTDHDPAAQDQGKHPVTRHKVFIETQLDQAILQRVENWDPL